MGRWVEGVMKGGVKGVRSPRGGGFGVPKGSEEGKISGVGLGED